MTDRRLHDAKGQALLNLPRLRKAVGTESDVQHANQRGQCQPQAAVTSAGEQGRHRK